MQLLCCHLVDEAAHLPQTLLFPPQPLGVVLQILALVCTVCHLAAGWPWRLLSTTRTGGPPHGRLPVKH